MKESRALTRARTFVGFLETWRYGVLLLVAVLTFGSLFLMRDLRFDNSDESFFTDDDPAVVAIERFRELFGNEDFVYVAVRNGGDIFDRDTLRLLDSLALALEKDVPEREKKIIILRYYRDKTQSEVAGIMGVSQVQISRIENKILSKIKESFNNK